MNDRIYYVDFGDELRTLTFKALERAVQDGEIDPEQGCSYFDPTTQEEQVGCKIKDILDD